MKVRSSRRMVAERRPVLRYHGGKFRLAPKLIALMPPHRVYTEAFGGGGSVLMQKPRCYSEIYNDLDREVVNVEDCLHYVDPPYPVSVRKIGNGTTPAHRYRFEMTDEDHEELARTLHSLKGMVMISSYAGPLYERLYLHWKKAEWTSGQLCGGTGKRTRTEVVWMNDAAWRASPLLRLW